MSSYNDIIEEVMEKNDIVDVISGYVKLTKKGSSYFGLCPFHNEKSASFSVSRNKQMYYCFGCGAGGNVYTFLEEYEKYSFREALQALAERAGVEIPNISYSDENRVQNTLKSQLFEINKKAATFYYYQLRSPNGSNAMEYFKSRCLSEETMKQFGLGYSTMYKDDLYQYLKKEGYKDDILSKSGLFHMDNRGVMDKFYNRVMFPILDVSNKVIGFGGRVMGEGEPKYLNSPETILFEKSRNLFGLNLARKSKKNNMIICEGYMDVITLHQAGFNQAVASLGTALTQGHANLLKRYIGEILVCYDSDGAGQKAATRAIPMLMEAGLKVKVINMQPYKDPDEFIKNLGAEEFQKRIDDATNGFMYLIETIEKTHDMKDPTSKTEFINMTAERLSEFSEELERNTYIQAVSDKYMLDYGGLKKLVVSYGEKRMMKISTEKQEKEEKKIYRIPKEDGVKTAQRILLTWLIEEDKLYSVVKKYIEIKDFVDPVYNKAAAYLFEQLENENVNPASILNRFEDETERREVAALFNAEINQDMGIAEKEKLFTETVYKVKKNSVDYMRSNAKDAAELVNIMKEQEKLNKMANMRISLK